MRKIITGCLAFFVLCQLYAKISKIKEWHFLVYKSAPSYEVTQSTEEKLKGKKSIKIVIKDKGKGRLVQKIKNLDAKKKYNLSFYYKTGDDFKGYFHVCAAAKRYSAKRSGKGWKKVEIRDICPVKNMIYLAIWFRHARGTVYLDDFTLIPQG